MVNYINKLITIDGMATIISMSLNETLLKEIDSITKSMGFSGRSEAIRAGMRSLVLEHKQQVKLHGVIDASLLLVHNEQYSGEVSLIRHNYLDIIKTQIHNHLENHKCLEIFVLKGDAKKIVGLLNEFETTKKIEFVKLIPFS